MPAPPLPALTNGQSTRPGTPRSAEPAASSSPIAAASTQAGAAPVRILRLAQVLDATGLGRSKIYELQAAGDFPTCVKLTNYAVGWIESEVQSWLVSRIARSRGIR